MNLETANVLGGIVFKEGDRWVARCLTIDHAAQADTPEAAIRECIEGVKADLEFAIEHDTLEFLQPAPVSDLVELWLASEQYVPKRAELTILRDGEPVQVDSEFRFSRTRSMAMA